MPCEVYEECTKMELRFLLKSIFVKKLIVMKGLALNDSKPIYKRSFLLGDEKSTRLMLPFRSRMLIINI